MTDLDLFRGLARQMPLEPLTNAEDYFAACDVQDELRESPEPAVQLYLRILTPIIEAYDGGYRAE